jgi:hypothetical protein
MQFIYLLLACLMAGLGFAALATWLMTTKGNTIRDVLAAENLKDANAIQLEIMKKIKISSNLPIVGLFMVGALVAIGLPGYSLHNLYNQKSGNPWTVFGEIKDYLQVVDRSKGEKVYVYYPEMGISPDGKFGIPLPNPVQMVLFESPNTNPLTLRMQLNVLENKVEVFADAFGKEPVRVALNGNVANLPQPLIMSRTLMPVTEVKNQPSAKPGIIDEEFKNVAVNIGSGQ